MGIPPNDRDKISERRQWQSVSDAVVALESAGLD